MHHKHLKLLGVVHDELVEAIGEKVAGGLVGSVTDGGLGDGTLEATTHARVDTLGLSPGVAELLESLVMVTLEGLGALLDDLRLHDGSNLGHDAVAGGL